MHSLYYIMILRHYYSISQMYHENFACNTDAHMNACEVNFIQNSEFTENYRKEKFFIFVTYFF